MPATQLPRVGVVKMASCDGCQLTLLDLEDELLAIGQRFDLVEFPEASSRRSSGPYDVLLVEGSISTPGQLEQIVELRARTKLLVTIGACATAGGIQAMRNWSDEPGWRASVYPQPEYVDSLATTTPTAAPDRSASPSPIAARSPLATARSMPARSPSSRGRSTCASGSPKRTLNSSTIGPASVSMRPAYRTPRYGAPSRAIRQAMGSNTVATARSTSGRPNHGTGA